MTDETEPVVDTPQPLESQAPLTPRPEYLDAFKTMTPEERMAAGKAARGQAPRAGHARWLPGPGRPDPVALLEAHSRSRLPEYVPVRFGRMLASPFAFLRGAAAVMAADLAGTPVSGIRTQLCGDAHLANFGVFASPERNLLIGINDFDETLPGPWEWDVKRLAASVVVAGRFLKLSAANCQDAVRSAVRSYRKRMADFAGLGDLALYYTHINAEALLSALPARYRAAAEQIMARARQRTNLQTLQKQSELLDSSYRIVVDAPLILRPSSRLSDGRTLVDVVRDWLDGYQASLAEDRRALVSRYQLVDVVQKVVGVGSVDLRCYVVLLRGYDTADLLFLQVKQAQASVLEAHLGPSACPSHGQRVVAGQRLMQAAPDPLLGWWQAPNLATGEPFEYYVRQLRDMKAGLEFQPGGWDAEGFAQYARLCGWALALAHARSGDPAMIHGYLGDSDRFDEILVEFAVAYADQTERDYGAFVRAARQGRIPVETGR